MATRSKISKSICVRKEETRIHKKLNLQRSLAPKQLIFTKIISGTQEHVNHHMIKISFRSCAPLDDYEECKIPKETVKKDQLWDKLIPKKEGEQLEIPYHV